MDMVFAFKQQHNLYSRSNLRFFPYEHDVPPHKALVRGLCIPPDRPDPFSGACADDASIARYNTPRFGSASRSATRQFIAAGAQWTTPAWFGSANS